MRGENLRIDDYVLWRWRIHVAKRKAEISAEIMKLRPKKHRNIILALQDEYLDLQTSLGCRVEELWPWAAEVAIHEMMIALEQE